MRSRSAPLTGKEHAQAGPRALKPVGSPEWCWQTVGYLKDSLRHVDEQWRESEAVLDELIRAQAWKVIPPGQPYKTLDKMLKAEVGLDRRTIKQRIGEARLANWGEIGGRHTRGDNITSGSRGTDQIYTIRRLKRDRPDLAEQVASGELSANAAAIQAGFRHRKVSVPVDSPESVAASLRKHMAPDDLARLAALLTAEEA